MRESLNIINQCLIQLTTLDYSQIASAAAYNDKIIPPKRQRIKNSMESLIHHFKLFTEGFNLKPSETYSCAEAPKGEFGIFLASNNSNKPFRCHIKAPGFLHLQSLDFLSRKHMLADVVTLIGTLDIVFGEVDR